MSSKKEEIISLACLHTIKKFELIEMYVKSWAYKLLNNQYCHSLVFIDCMCNSGEYFNDNKEQVFGTPVRVAKILEEASRQYFNKTIELYFNDFDENKINHLKSLLPTDRKNFYIHYSVSDANELLKIIAPTIVEKKYTNYLLVYDPYEASIDWSAIMPYINNWGEVIINHMLHDSTRAIGVVKKPEKIEKYEETYLSDINKLLTYGSDKNAYEKRIQEIIIALRNKTWRKYYLASFPFFNCKNAIVYNLIHCTSSIDGCNLYKTTAWKVFGGKSSTKDIHGKEQQYVMDFDNDMSVVSYLDEDCYYIKDISEYLQKEFCGQTDVPINALWELLDVHPVFPSIGFRNEIKKDLKDNYGAIIIKNKISFKKKD